jgi:hypothetical protein
MLSVPKVAVIEFYNASLNHFFIAAASQPDVPALDSGAIPGWTRTGATFNAYAGGESGLAGVCRFYIPPAKGNSHFYSVSADECSAIYDAAYNVANPAHATYAGFIRDRSAFVLDVPVDGTCSPCACPCGARGTPRRHQPSPRPASGPADARASFIDEGIVMCALP